MSPRAAAARAEVFARELSFDEAQVVVLSSIDWAAAWQRHQIFASQFAAAGRDVFFVENTGFRNPSAADWKRVKSKLRRLGGQPAQDMPLPTGLKVVAPAVLPPTFMLFRAANNHALLPGLVRQIAAEGLRPGPIVFVYSPTRSNLRLLELLRPSMVVYDCASNFRGHARAPHDLATVERELLSRSDLVVTDSDFLFEQKKAEHGNVLQLHQGVAEGFFDAKPPSTQWRRFCYYGTWIPDLDERYLNALADAGFEVTVSGFTRGPEPALSPKIKRLGPAPLDKLVERLEQHDVFILPHKINEFMKGVLPAKIYECLAMGRPILAAPLPSLSPVKDLIYVADGPEAWVRVARDLPNTETDQRRQERLARAREHTHAREFERLVASMRAAWPGRAAPARAAAPWWSVPAIVEFVQGLSWIGVLFGAARALTLLGQVIAGRLLGPEEFGRANVVVALAAFIQVAPMLGFPMALGKYPAEAGDDDKRATIIGTGLLAFTCWAAASAAAFWLAHGALARLGGFNPEIVAYAGLLAFCTAGYTVLASPLLGLKRFAQRGLSEAVYGGAAPTLMLALIASGERSFRAFVLGLCGALIIASAFAVQALRGHVRWTVDAVALRRLLGYSALAAVSLLTAACVVGPGRLLLQRFATHGEVGVFSAYFTATVQVSLASLTTLSAVLLPIASAGEGQERAWKAAHRFALPAALGGFLVFCATGAAALAVFGGRYPFRPGWLLLFAAGADLVLLHGAIGTLYAARDLRGLRVSVTGAALAAVANVALCWTFIPRWGVAGAAAALPLAYAAALGYYLYKARWQA